jgi:hypothetical protein
LPHLHLLPEDNCRLGLGWWCLWSCGRRASVIHQIHRLLGLVGRDGDHRSSGIRTIGALGRGGTEHQAVGDLPPPVAHPALQRPQQLVGITIGILPCSLVSRSVACSAGAASSQERSRVATSANGSGRERQ